jgi:hypothetical protein
MAPEKRVTETVILDMEDRTCEVRHEADCTPHPSSDGDLLAATPENSPGGCALGALADLPDSKRWWNSERAYQADVIVAWMKAEAKRRNLKLSATHVGINKVMASAMANKNDRRRMMVKDSMFLALKTIGERAGCSERTARDIVTDLVEGYRLYTTSVIPGRMLRGRPASKGHRFDGVRFHLNPAIWDAIPIPWYEQNKKKDENPVPPPVEPLSAEAQATLDAIVEGDPGQIPAPSAAKPKQTTEAEAWREVYNWLVQEFPDHPSVRINHADKMLKPIIDDCIEQVGNPKLVIEVLRCLPEKRRQYLAHANHLGGLIRKGIRSWLDAKIDYMADDLINDKLRSQSQVVILRAEYSPILERLRTAYEEKLGEDLWSFKITSLDGGEHQIEVTVSDDYALKHQLEMGNQGECEEPEDADGFDSYELEPEEDDLS